jgi:hypothetical protein
MGGAGWRSQGAKNMNKVGGKLVLGALLLAGLVAAPSSQASEPSNNNAPWITGVNGLQSFWGDVSAFQAKGTGGQFINFDNIMPAGDVDFHQLSCQNGTVKSASLNFTHANGDLDIQVFDLSGNLLGTSNGVTNTEVVNVASQNKQAVILKVVGYLNATNPTYNITIGC